MKKFVSILVGLITLPLFAFGAANDATLSNSGAEITIGSNTFVLSGRESVMDSVTISSSDISIVTTAGVFFQITSADKLNFTVSPAEYKTRFECQSAQSVLTVEAGSSVSTTITITPGSACTVDGGGGGGGGGGGSSGGGSSYSYSAAPATPVTPAATTGTTVTTTTGTQSTQSTSGASSATQGASPSILNSGNLTLGSKSSAVMDLQKFLNANGYQVSSSGAGSPGSETSTFGSLTRAALAKWQAAHGVSPAVGYFGPVTRAAMAVSGGAVPASAPAPTANNSALIQILLKQIEALQVELRALQAQSASAPAAPTPAPASAPAPASTHYDPFAPTPGSSNVLIGT